ncbi:MAG: tryptophan--tRNA ligase, partial [Elusimicrobiaceae bacterium]|nr:tryptophan--tRNA ligase [Elusimicrobiaceae bacterium]
MTKDKKIIVSGMRPTGVLHLGNYHGALKNWIELQNTHECFFCVVDYHALTTAYDKTEDLQANIRDMLKSWLAAGLDPKKCSIYIQSHLPQTAEVNLLLGMITPLGWLLRNPSYKEQLEEIFRKKYKGQLSKSASEKVGMLSEKELSELSSFGFLGYPVLMASDILIHGADLVPVGQDQLVHLELTRDIAKKFN